MYNKGYDKWLDQMEQFVHQAYGFYKSQLETEVYTSGRKKFGSVELGILTLFEWKSHLTVKEAITALKVPNSTITSAINRLENQDILKREIHPTDRRIFNLTLTKKGTDLLNYRRLEKRQLYYYLLDSLDSDTERETFMDLLTKLRKPLSTINQDMIRRIHMDILKKEYDAFGPWIIEIKDATEVPPQFAKESERIMNSNLSIKIPRNIERRNAKAGMPLYNHVLVMNDDDLLFMSRKETLITTTTIAYKDVQSIECINDLLFGEMVLVAGNSRFNFHFNPVSYDIVEKVIGIVREKYYTEPAHIDLSTINETIEVETPLYQNLLNRDMKGEEMKPIAYQPFIELVRQNQTTIEFLMDRYSKPVLQDSLYLTNGKELIILDRVKEVKREREADYGYKHIFIPLKYIGSITTSADESMENLKNLELNYGSSTVVLKVAKDFDENKIRSIIG